MGRQEVERLFVERYTAFQEDMLIGAPGGDQHTVQDLRLLAQLAEDVGAAFPVVVPFEQHKQRQKRGAHAEPELVAKFHCPSKPKVHAYRQAAGGS